MCGTRSPGPLEGSGTAFPLARSLLLALEHPLGTGGRWLKVIYPPASTTLLLEHLLAGS